MKAPQYRLRLFLSADLVGSTAFKAGAGRRTMDDQAYPVWVNLTNHFYRRFPAGVLATFRDLVTGESAEAESYPAPRLWKTIGDEIVLCCRVETLGHLTDCVCAFVRAMERYSAELRGGESGLDVKGTAWLAAFPAPNFTVFSDADADQGEFPDEAFETVADEAPHNHDFLGSEIDSGFRISGYSTADRMVVSAALGLMLCEAAKHRRVDLRFNYHGRHSLKGVLDGSPYPIVSIDTERNAKKREVRDFENALTDHHEIDPLRLAGFLRAFMEDEGLERPILGEQAGVPVDPPPSYRTFIQRWATVAEEIAKRTAAEVQSDSEDGLNADNRPMVTQNLDMMVPERKPKLAPEG